MRVVVKGMRAVPQIIDRIVRVSAVDDTSGRSIKPDFDVVFTIGTISKREHQIEIPTAGLNGNPRLVKRAVIGI
jgi:hypothetical protein